MAVRFLFAIAVITATALISPALSQSAASAGMLKICKQGNADEYPEPDWWRREVIVPAGIAFRDVGPIDDNAGDWIRLQIVTTQFLSLKGNQKCGVVPAFIPRDQSSNDFGRKPVGAVVYEIAKDAGRLLEVMKWGDSPTPPPKLGPWADVVGVGATVDADFRPSRR